MLSQQMKHKSTVAVLIDTATNGASQQEENWSLFMHICDLINRSHVEGAKDAAKAIRKRLGCKVPEDICLTLKLLETCMKNCGRQFHVHVATPKFMQEMIKAINPKYHPSIGMQNLVLGLIQAWAEAFKSVPELREFSKTYQDLKLKGVEFPPLDPELALIGKQRAPKVTSSSAPSRSVPQTHVNTGNKLVDELATVRNNCKVFGELLTEMKPGQETAADVELLEDLNTTCRQMQKRITELIEAGKFEQHTEELLLVNDELNNAFLRYDRFKRVRADLPPIPQLSQPFQLEPTGFSQQDNVYSEGTSSRQPNAPNVYGNAAPVYDTLIDLGTDTTAAPASSYPPGYQPPAVVHPTPQLADLSIYDNDVLTVPGFPPYSDPFVVPSNLPWQQPTMLSSASSSSTGIPPQVTDRESDFAEMEKWLKANPRASNAEPDSVSNDEFDRFLSSRAREIERLPSVTPSQTEQQKSADTGQLFSL